MIEHKKSKINYQHGPNQKSGLNAGAREGKAVPTS